MCFIPLRYFIRRTSHEIFYADTGHLFRLETQKNANKLITDPYDQKTKKMNERNITNQWNFPLKRFGYTATMNNTYHMSTQQRDT